MVTRSQRLQLSMSPKEAVFQERRDVGGVMPPAYHQGKEEDGKLLEVLLEMKSGEEPLIKKLH